MATELPATTVSTPSAETVITTTVKRSWKGRAFSILSALLSFIVGLLAYLQTINLANLGITADRALFYMTAIGIAQFVLLQINPLRLVEQRAEPAPPGGRG